ncbi:MAG: helix-turn-helix transcriptional regulator [Spirochaetota bacterium]
MRADRLLQIVMLLQARGSTTAERLARELGVSQRTIYRDMEALDTAGVPIVAEAGPSGGYTLLSGYRSELNGLTDDEVAALGLLAVPGATADLGVSETLRRAIEKILASVPRFASSAGERVRERILVNPTADAKRGGAINGGTGDAKGEDVGARTSSRPRSVALDGIADAVTLEEPSAIAPRFDLRDFWAAHAREARRRAGAFAYEIRVVPTGAGDVRRALGASMGVTELADSPDGGRAANVSGDACRKVQRRDAWPRFRCTAPNLAAARSALLPLGGAVEVIDPPELRRSIADFAEQAASRYRPER